MSEREYIPRPIEPMNRPATPEYSRYSNVQLGLALWGNTVRTMSADLGHSVIEGWILGLQLINWLLNEGARDEEIDWTPDATGINPTFDRWAAQGRRSIPAIRDELLRRATHPRRWLTPIP